MALWHNAGSNQLNWYLILNTNIQILQYDMDHANFSSWAKCVRYTYMWALTIMRWVLQYCHETDEYDLFRKNGISQVIIEKIL